MAQYAAAIKLATAVIGTGVAVKSSVDQKAAQKESRRAQEQALAEQKKAQKQNAIQQNRQLDEVNKRKAGTQKSIIGAMFQKTLTGSRTGVTNKMGGGS
jgi:hypothetical protein